MKLGALFRRYNKVLQADAGKTAVFSYFAQKIMVYYFHNLESETCAA
jgi:hypothetical protein